MHTRVGRERQKSGHTCRIYCWVKSPVLLALLASGQPAAPLINSPCTQEAWAYGGLYSSALKKISMPHGGALVWLSQVGHSLSGRHCQTIKLAFNTLRHKPLSTGLLKCHRSNSVQSPNVWTFSTCRDEALENSDDDPLINQITTPQRDGIIERIFRA